MDKLEKRIGYVPACFIHIRSLLQFYLFSSLLGACRFPILLFKFYSRHGARLGRHSMRLASESPVNRSLAGSHLNFLPSNIAMLPR